MKQLDLPSAFAAVPGRIPASIRRAVGFRRWPDFHVRGRIFVKYVALFVAVVCIALLANGGFQMWFFYKEHTASLIRIQRQQAEAVAIKIEQFLKEIESQLGWTTQLPWVASTLEQRRINSLRLLNQVPAITELTQIDPQGRERLHVSRLEMDVIDSRKDYSHDPIFTEAVANKRFYSTVHFRNDSEPYLTLALAGSRRDTGVSVAEVNLKFIWDLISQIKVGKDGRAMVIDALGRLIAHPDISLVLRNIDLSGLRQVQVARAAFPDTSSGTVDDVRDLQGRTVLSAHALITPVSWLVFVELPTNEAYAPLYATIRQMAFVLFGALMLAVLSGMVLARKMVVPIQALGAGAARIGKGDLSQNISIKTGDELEALADQFNDMAGKLRDSYADMEHKVQIRTQELAQSIDQLKALGEVSQAVNSTLDLETVLTTIVAKAVQLSGAEAGAVYVFDDSRSSFSLRATYGMDQEIISALSEQHIGLDHPHVSTAIADRRPIQIADLRNETPTSVNRILARAGYRALLVAPLLRPDKVTGMLVVRRKEPGLFGRATVDLLTTFAAQSVLAIQNARLFSEIDEKSRQIEIASKHKSQFLANMSHELRTPLNAILGYTELILDNIYGPVPEKMRRVVDRVQVNGQHLLGLINEVLDLTKIEAGQLTLSISDYSMRDVIDSVFHVVESLAAEKQLKLRTDVPSAIPPGRGDERRLAQVLLNLVGNAIKFTDSGEVVIAALTENGNFTVSVRDTGPGISPQDQCKIFDEFQQAGTSEPQLRRGTGLGLSIAKRIIDVHGGRIWVNSIVGEGATFTFTIPIIVERQAQQS